MALSVTDQSTSVRAASRFLVPFTMAVASMSQPEPSEGKTMSGRADRHRLSLDGGRFHVPAGALRGKDDVDRRALALLPGRAKLEGHADRILTGARHRAGLGAGVGVDADV